MAFLRAANVDEIPPGQVKVARVGDQQIVLCHVGGEFYALANVCTHDDGPLGEGCLHGDEIECPRHGARFDVKTGKVRALPAIVPVPAYPVKIQGEELWVDTE